MQKNMGEEIVPIYFLWKFNNIDKLVDDKKFCWYNLHNTHTTFFVQINAI